MLRSFFSRPDPDAPLVVAARAGEARAFDALVYRYQSRMTQFVRARLHLAIDADDVVQDIFVTAWHELPAFQGRSRFKTWLFGIALNCCAEAARRHLRLRRLLGDLGERDLAQLPADEREGPLEVMEQAEIRERLLRLPEPDRQVLELYYYAELNLREISELLEVNLSTLKYRFYQAHRRLREHLEGRAPSAGRVPAGERRG